MSAPGMAAQQSAQCKPKSFDDSVLLECLDGVLRASGSESAGWRRERRDVALVEAYGSDEQAPEWVGAHEDSGDVVIDDCMFSSKQSLPVVTNNIERKKCESYKFEEIELRERQI